MDRSSTHDPAAGAQVPVPDEDLVGAVRQGQTRLFGILVERYRPMVYYTIWGNAPRSDDVDDLVQETFTAALAKLGQLRQPERFGPWLGTLARRVAVSHLRRQSAYRRCLVRWPTPELGPPEDAVEREEEARRLRGGLNLLSPIHRRLLWLHYVEGCSCDWLAGRLGMPVGTVKRQLHRARESLRRGLLRQDRLCLAAVRASRAHAA
ncbi:MAG: sigma-70 family RNA polymerase sigma factor [Candidatus Latescibacterota bacterium]